MRLFIAESLPGVPIIEIISRTVHSSQEPIYDNIFSESKKICGSDAILVPHDAYDFVNFQDYMSYIKNLSKSKLIIFSDRGDFPKNPNFNNSISLRVAINPSESKKNKIVVPYNVKKLDNFNYRNYAENPKLSFMGYMPKFTLGRMIKVLETAPLNPILGNSSLVRRISIAKIRRSQLDFVFTNRQTYHLSQKDRELRNIWNLEYLAQIENSDIVLCPRGDANQSQRFYEVLSAGRIPLIPNTKILFPFHSKHEQFYKKNLIFFDLLRPQVNRLTLDYWNQIKNQDSYFKLQKANRDFYLNVLEFNGFMRRLFAGDLTSFMKLASFATYTKLDIG